MLKFLKRRHFNGLSIKNIKELLSILKLFFFFNTNYTAGNRTKTVCDNAKVKLYNKKLMLISYL